MRSHRRADSNDCRKDEQVPRTRNHEDENVRYQLQDETSKSHALATDPVSHGEEENRSEQETCKIGCGN